MTLSLSPRDAGLPYQQFKDDIAANLRQARHYHLKPRPDGLVKTATDYFVGYMADIAAESYADGLASMRDC